MSDYPAQMRIIPILLRDLERPADMGIGKPFVPGDPDDLESLKPLDDARRYEEIIDPDIIMDEQKDVALAPRLDPRIVYLGQAQRVGKEDPGDQSCIGLESAQRKPEGRALKRSLIMSGCRNDFDHK